MCVQEEQWAGAKLYAPDPSEAKGKITGREVSANKEVCAIHTINIIS